MISKTDESVDLTAELRCMLDERGVRYQVPNSAMRIVQTTYKVDGWDVSVDSVCNEYLEVEMERCVDTPEQAIAVTLGSKGVAGSLDEMSELRAENAKLWKLLQGFLSEHPEYLAEVIEVIGSLDLEHAMQHDQEYYRRKAKKLGIEVE